MTTTTQIAIAKAIAEEINKTDGVLECVVDDWTDYGSFSYFVNIKNEMAVSMGKGWRFRLKTDLRSITASIKRAIKKYPNVSLKWIQHPKPRYYKTTVGHGRWRSDYDGHDSSVTQFMVDVI